MLRGASGNKPEFLGRALALSNLRRIDRKLFDFRDD
jgi:hypothetical protein